MFLLDTNVVSELRKVRAGRADGHVAAWADSVDAADLYLSVISVQELEMGVLLAERRDPAQGAVFRAWLDGHVLPAFAGRILVVRGRRRLDSAHAQARRGQTRPGGRHCPLARPRSFRDRVVSRTGIPCGRPGR